MKIDPNNKPKASLKKVEPQKIELNSSENTCTLCNTRPIWTGNNSIYCCECYMKKTQKRSRGPSGIKTKDLSENQIINRNKVREDKEFGVYNEF